MRMWSTCGLIVWAISAAWSSHAFAESADDLIRQGVELRRAGRDDEALVKFREAYRSAPGPRAAAQLGLCAQALGRWVEADEMVSEALIAKDDPWILKHREALEQSLTTIKAHVARVAVLGDPAGAEVVVAGKEQGRLPLPGAVRVSAGATDIEVRAPGYKRVVRTVAIPAGAYQTIVVHLEREPAASGAPHAPGPATERPAAMITRAPSTTTETPPRSTRRIVAWTTGGAALAALAFAGVELAIWSKRTDRFNSHTGPSQDDPAITINDCGAALPSRGGSGCAALYDDARRAQVFTTVGFVAAGALAATSAVLFVTSPKTRTHFRAAVDPRGASIALQCGFRF